MSRNDSIYLLSKIDEMLPEIHEAVDDIDEMRRLSQWLADRLASAGLFHLLTDVGHGGLGTDPVTAVKVIERLSAVSPSVGWVSMILSSASFWIIRAAPNEVRRKIFAGTTHGEIQHSVIAGTLVPHGKAVKVDGGWLLNGQWPFGSGCHLANWLPSGAWIYDVDEAIIDIDGVPQWRVFYVPASDCNILDTWFTLGLRGTGSTDYTMSDVFVPDTFVTRHSLLEPSKLLDNRYIYPALNIPMMSAVALGTARGAIDSLIELLSSKIDRKNKQPVATSFDKQLDLGVAVATLDSARAYLYDVTYRAWELIQSYKELPSELRAGMRLACTHAVEASVKVVDIAHSMAGASSIYSSSSLDRFFRDIHTISAHAFMRHSTMADGGQLLLGQEPPFHVF